MVLHPKFKINDYVRYVHFPHYEGVVIKVYRNANSCCVSWNKGTIASTSNRNIRKLAKHTSFGKREFTIFEKAIRLLKIMDHEL